MFSRSVCGLRLAVQVVWLAIALLLSTASGGLAQTQADLAERMGASIRPLVEETARIEQKLIEGKLSEKNLTALRQELERLNKGALERITRFQPEIVSLNQAFDRLPPKPGDDQPAEPAEIVDERKRLADIKARSSLAVKDAELISVKSVGLMNRVLEARRSQFLSSILKQRRLNVNTFVQVWREIPAQISTFWSTLSGWVVAALHFNTWSVVALIALSMAISTTTSSFSRSK